MVENIVPQDQNVTPIDLDLKYDDMTDDFFDAKEEPEIIEIPVLNQDTNDTVNELSLEETCISNIDAMFENLYNDVLGANNLITDLIDKKKEINTNQVSLNEFQKRLENERSEFAEYVTNQKEALELERQQIADYSKVQKARIQEQEVQFNKEAEATKSELNLQEDRLNHEKESFLAEKTQFNSYKQLEEEKLKNEYNKLETERQQLIREKEIVEESHKNSQKELEMQQDNFKKYKELEEKRIELENNNLSQSCARFKELVAQFNNGFSQLPKDE